MYENFTTSYNEFHGVEISYKKDSAIVSYNFNDKRNLFFKGCSFEIN